MAESDFEENGLIVKPQYYNKLDVGAFSLMLKDPSFCYKFYWLEAIVKLISEGATETTFDAVIDEMIANAWYSVREFHIHLSGLQMGEVRDGLERTIMLLSDLSGLPSNASKTEIKNQIDIHNKELNAYKLQLTNMVPFRALAGFFNRTGLQCNWDSKKAMVGYIEQVNKAYVTLPYVLGYSNQLNREVYFHPDWVSMIQDNTVTILAWIQHEKVKWLQMNNPEVPGLVFKLAPANDKMRKLGHVRTLWDSIMRTTPVRDVFTGNIIDGTSFDVDHFIPWSFTMNDELWNLMPMESSLNSSKNNKLPRWDPFFERFAMNQYSMYKLISDRTEIRNLYEKCYRDNLHSIWAQQDLYKPGNSKEMFLNILSRNMRPVYDSAERQGYEVWNY